MVIPRGTSLRAGLVSGNVHLLLPARCCRRLYSKTTFREHDVVLLRKTSDKKAAPVLSKPLISGAVIKELQRSGYSKDSLDADDVIGKGVRDLVTSRRGTDYRIYEPTLGEYTKLSQRLVTPIYPQEANIIVSLLDLHPSTPGSGDDERLEIFEAGTGHGALTLHLARAIHGANTPAPEIPSPARPQTAPPLSSESLSGQDVSNEDGDLYEAWRANRRAVIHTLDNSGPHSRHAENIVKNFRRGMYYPHIDFHVGDIGEYLSPRIASNNDEPFLTHAILDLPNTHEYLELVGEALKPNGSVVTWNPSITQTIKCLDLVRERRLPFILERVLEVGAGVASGGRDWDVRSVKPRARVKAEALARQDLGNARSDEEPETLAESIESGVEDAEVAQAIETSERESQTPTGDSGWEMVCRPKVGLRIEGGGFIGLWRRKAMNAESVV